MSPATPKPRLTLAVIILRVIGWMAGLAALLLLTAWTGSRIVSDRIYEVQFLSWVPSWVYLLPAALLALLTPLAGVRGGGGRRARETKITSSGEQPPPVSLSPVPPPPAAPPAPSPEPAAPLPPRPLTARLLVRMTMLWAAGGVAWALLVEDRLWARFVPAPETPAVLRVLHWNLEAPDATAWSGRFIDVTPEPPDIVVASSYQNDDRFEDSLDALGTPAQPWHTARSGHLRIASAFPVVARRAIPLGLESEERSPPRGSPADLFRRALQEIWNRAAADLGSPPRGFARGESGDLFIVTLDTSTLLGHHLTIYLIDLPSDPLAPRYRNAQRIRRILDAARSGSDPLPPPDLIVGDFNTPRRAASMALITDPLTHAHALAGHGRSATWPRGFPLLHIDHAFVGTRLRALEYRILPTPVSDHLAQWLRLGRP